jgi:hypothetical protein
MFITPGIGVPNREIAFRKRRDIRKEIIEQETSNLQREEEKEMKQSVALFSSGFPAMELVPIFLELLLFNFTSGSVRHPSTFFPIFLLALPHLKWGSIRLLPKTSRFVYVFL